VPAELDDSDAFEMMLIFSGAECPGCGVAREPGVCPECGSDVPAADQVHELARARRNALGGLADEARDLRDAFSKLPAPRIRVSPGQYAGAVSDSGVFRLAADMPALGYSLAELDLNDPKTIGVVARRTIQTHLAAVRRLLDASRDLAMLEPAGPAVELRDIAVRTGAWGADVVVRLLEAITATEVVKARAAQADLQRLLNGSPVNEIPEELYDRLSEWMVPDLDERVSRAFNRPAWYSDDLGFLDFADGGHGNLPVGGHQKSPSAAAGSPHGWPSVLPAVSS